MNTYLLVLLLCRPGAEIPCGYDTIMVEVENIQTKAKCEAQAREFRKRNRKVYRGHFCTKETQLRI